MNRTRTFHSVKTPDSTGTTTNYVYVNALDSDTRRNHTEVICRQSRNLPQGLKAAAFPFLPLELLLLLLPKNFRNLTSFDCLDWQRSQWMPPNGRSQKVGEEENSHKKEAQMAQQNYFPPLRIRLSEPLLVSIFRSIITRVETFPPTTHTSVRRAIWFHFGETSSAHHRELYVRSFLGGEKKISENFPSKKPLIFAWTSKTRQ